MEVGEYVRTRNYGICKITGFESKNVFFADYAMGYVIKTKEIVKHSKNIIELIEVGDCIKIGDDIYQVIYDESYEKLGILIPDRNCLTITHSAIEFIFQKFENVSIITKEQFKFVEYEV